MPVDPLIEQAPPDCSEGAIIAEWHDRLGVLITFRPNREWSGTSLSLNDARIYPHQRPDLNRHYQVVGCQLRRARVPALARAPGQVQG